MRETKYAVLSTRFEEMNMREIPKSKDSMIFYNFNNGDENESDNLYQKQLENGKETFNGNHGGHHDDASLGETVDNKEQFLINDNVKKPIQTDGTFSICLMRTITTTRDVRSSLMFSDGKAPRVEGGPAKCKINTGIYSQSNKISAMMEAVTRSFSQRNIIRIMSKRSTLLQWRRLPLQVLLALPSLQILSSQSSHFADSSNTAKIVITPSVSVSQSKPCKIPMMVKMMMMTLVAYSKNSVINLLLPHSQQPHCEPTVYGSATQ
ncbi:CNT_collapsed_G0015180.mRNA.1.CDS.1 [Saccharomyces cerevisiae]|nr:CNT_collapsed_G0015180.mRNA.1.CDS.1 [Saccharomyces cerevisiae]